MAPGVVGAAHERPGLHMAKAKFFCCYLELLELIRWDIALYGKLICGRPEVLPQCNDIAVVLAHIAERSHDLVEGLSYTEHQARLGENISPYFFGTLQNIQRSLVNGARPYLFVKPRDGFHVVVEDLNPGTHHGLKGSPIPFEIGNQDFNPDTRTQGLDPENRFGKVSGAAVRKVVSIH